MKRVCLLLVALLPLLLNSEIYVLKINGPIESITEEYISDSFKTIKENGDADLVIIELDTPGGLLPPTEEIIKEIMDSPAPVAAYVFPKGASAFSAGFIIAMAADIVAMAPGTSMGSAHPVSVTGKMEETMKEKVTNAIVSKVKSFAESRKRNIELAEQAVRKSVSYTADECLKKNLSEFTCQDIDDLITQLEGKEITMVNGKSFKLDLKESNKTTLDLSARQKFLKTITNPNLAFFLLIFGLIGLYLEFTHPGAIIPGVLGGISLLLAFMAFQILPIDYIGLLLILLSIGFFIAEIKIQGFGAFGVGGIVSFILGSIMLINSPIPEMRPTMSIIIVFGICVGVLFLFLTWRVIKAMKSKAETGKEGLTGESGIAKTEITQTKGKVFVHGEWWNAISDEKLPEGTDVIIESVDDFILKVRKK
jgi:membrane-bound serine protease (ClpP class)